MPPFLDFSEALAGREARAFGIGPEQDLWVLAGDEVLRFGGTGAPPARLLLPGTHRHVHYVQPLPGGEVVLVDGRCRYIAKDQHERNAAVYTHEGTLAREFTLGDGIQEVQATSEGRLWVSYFDEGVIGNYGWRHGGGDNAPIGQAGLVLFDAAGQRLSAYDSVAAGTDIIVDCYALNVASDDETWLCFYTDFPLVRLRSGEAPLVWETPVRGVRALAVNATHVLFGGSYKSPGDFQLYRLHDKGVRRLRPVRSLELTDEAGTPWKPTWLSGRGPWMYGIEGTRAFRIDVDTLVVAVDSWHSGTSRLEGLGDAS
ncbi:hypothetical protein [Pyxidicoccus trucidator]|uniref:hypothetical protein n=1 Tax=Pyxidicoccus trucidator TaxID=2709662 RepID=UPI0013DCD043|nr:hypothetical protein [Pyxidicoccus trucidator]